MKDCFPESSPLVAGVEGSLGFLLPERRQNSAFCVRVDSQGFLLGDGEGCRGKAALGLQGSPRRGGASLDSTPTTGHPRWGQELLTRVENWTGLAGPKHLGHLIRPQLRDYAFEVSVVD